MAEETIQSAQEAPVQETPVPEIPVPAPEAPNRNRKGSPLLVILTVLLTLVGITDLVLWGVVGYYFLRNF